MLHFDALRRLPHQLLQPLKRQDLTGFPIKILSHSLTYQLKIPLLNYALRGNN